MRVITLMVMHCDGFSIAQMITSALSCPDNLLGGVMKMLFALTCFLGVQIVQASTSIEVVLRSNFSTTQRYGHMNGDVGSQCFMYLPQPSGNAQYALAGGFIDVGPTAWAPTYGPVGNPDNPYWSIDTRTSSLTFAGFDSHRENYVRFDFDSKTLKIFKFTEYLPIFNLEKRECLLGQ